ncbi:MAG: hypothetical protein R3Y24_12140 [Eubacteriales bacterium]
MYLIKTININYVILIIVTILAVFVPKWLWSLSIQLNQANVSFSKSYNFAEFWKVIVGEDTVSYRAETFANFTTAFLNDGITLFNITMNISYFYLSLIFIILGIILHICWKRWVGHINKSFINVSVVLIVQTIIYVVGLCASYMFKFSEYEAVRLASFSRYMNIVYFAIALILLLISIDLLWNASNESEVIQLCLLLVIILTFSVDRVTNFISGQNVKDSYEIRIQFDELTENVKENITDTSKGIYFISQNEYFIENFAEVFENPEDIKENSVYEVNKNTGLLVMSE